MFIFRLGVEIKVTQSRCDRRAGIPAIIDLALPVLPLFGPSSIRDGVGRLGDIFLDPLTYVGQAYDVQTELLLVPLVKGIDIRSRNIETLEDLERDSIDFYARIRSLWRQNRQSEIEDGPKRGSTR